MSREYSALARRVRLLIRSKDYRHNDQLPPERELCEVLGVSRHRLRVALDELENDGLIWRHVGRGTFVGARPVLNLDDVAYLKALLTPLDVVAVRLTLEPELARLAAQNATTENRDQIRACARNCRTAADWRGYEAWDNNLHHAIAQASKNKLFLYFFETLNVVRRSMVWGQKRTTRRPARDYASFGEHDRIFEAIHRRDGDAAAIAMKAHVESVYTRVLPSIA